MTTVIRPEVSKHNKYYISKHRYYELKHFCLQYKEWKQIYNELCGFLPGGIHDISNTENYFVPNSIIEKREKYLDMIELVETCAKLADPDLSNYILRAVTEERSYDFLSTVMRIPCCKDIYYEKYRKFFWILSTKKEFA